MSSGLFSGTSGLAVGVGLNRGASGLWDGASGPQILLSVSSIAENAVVGSTVGVLSVASGEGTWTFTKTADPDSKFAVSGSNLNTAAGFDFETAQSHSVTIQATNGTDTISRTFSISVTNVFEQPTLSALSVPASVSRGTTISITGATAGSTITGTMPTGWTLNGAARTIAIASDAPTGSQGWSLTETLVDSANSPRTSSGSSEVNSIAAYDPVTIFTAAPTDGMLYDPQTISSLFQDTAGTIPVTANGQLVARINDRSGNGIHLIQANTALQYRYRDDGVLKWLDTEGRACIYATTKQLTGPVSIGFAAEITQNTSGGNLFDTGPTSAADANSVYFSWSTGAPRVDYQERGASTLTTRSIVLGANRHMAFVARLYTAAQTDFVDYGKAAPLPSTQRLGANTTSGTGFRMGPGSTKQIRIYGLFVAFRTITDAERELVAAHYAGLGRTENLALWIGDVNNG